MLGLSGEALFTAVMALTLGLQGAWSLLKTLRSRASAVGTVSDMKLGADGLVPVVDFVGADGTAGRFCADHDGYLKLGETVPVRYDRRAPHRVRIATFQGSYLRPILALVLAPFVLSLARTIETRHDSVAPLDRVAVYIPLRVSLLDLESCARRSCSAARLERRLHAYDRARVAAEPLASPSVRAGILDVQRSLRAVRRGGAHPPAAPIAALRSTLIDGEAVPVP